MTTSDGLIRIACTETGVRFMYNGNSRVTMGLVTTMTVEDAWRQTDDWHRLEKQGVKQPHKLVSKPVTGMTIVDALRQKVERLAPTGELR